MSAEHPFENDRGVAADKGGWDLVLQPRRPWLDLKLPDLWRYRDLVLLFVRRDFVAQYKQTILGPLWFVIQPLLSTIVFTVVFGTIAGLSTDGLPKPLFYLGGQVVWGYFASVLVETSGTFVTHAHLFGKVYFPRLAVPLSIVISGLLKFALQLLFFLCFLVYFRHHGAPVSFSMSLWLLPVLLLIMASLGLGLGIIFSSMTTKYRDLRFLLQFGVNLLMYATPVIYPLSSIQGRYRLAILLNPVTAVVESFRHAFLGVGSFSWPWLGYSAGVAFASLFFGVMVFNRVEQTFMDTV